MKRIFLCILFCYLTNSYANTASAKDRFGTALCKNEAVDVSTLKENHVMLIPFFNNQEVWIYKRNKHQISKSFKSINKGYDSKIAAWWPQDKNPLDKLLSTSATRSSTDDYFIFYGYSPVGGYYLMYFSEKNNAKEEYPYLGNDWEGGFVDVVNQIAYDFTGRPIVINIPTESTMPQQELAKSNLMIPKYKFSSNKETVTLLCK